ncbi:hypothetical protein [Microvirga sp. M2]|uniref:hypothetical protein n=1 Tax=Microvirga sp. M2 TaxID=3073270 RepID=UPI0039C41994
MGSCDIQSQKSRNEKQVVNMDRAVTVEKIIRRSKHFVMNVRGVGGIRNLAKGVRSEAASPARELEGLSRDRLLHIAAQSPQDDVIYKIFQALFRLRNFKSAVKVASYLDVRTLTDRQALTVARAMLSNDRGTEGDLLIEERWKASDVRALSPQTALAFADAVYLSGLMLDRKIAILKDIEENLGREKSLDRVTQYMKWIAFKLTYDTAIEIDLLQFVELERFDVENPAYQLRYLPYLKALGYDAEIRDLLTKLSERYAPTDAVLFLANMKADPLWINRQILSCTDFTSSFLEDVTVLAALAEHRKAAPLLDELYQRSISAQIAMYQRSDIFRKGVILANLLEIEEVGCVSKLTQQEAHTPNTLLPAITGRGMDYFAADDYLSAKDCFLAVLEEDPADKTAGLGLSLTLPRTGHGPGAILDVRARIGYGTVGRGRSGNRSDLGKDFTISRLFNGDLVAGQYSKRHNPYGKIMKAAYGEKFLNYQELPFDRSSSARLFVIGDSGVGDEIRTAQFYSQLVTRFKQVTISCDPRMQSMFERSFPQIEFVPVWRYRKGLLDRQDKMNGRIKGLGEKMTHILTEECRDHIANADYVTFGENIFFNYFTGAVARPPVGSYLTPDKVALPKEVGSQRKLRVGILWRSHFRTLRRKFHYLQVEDFAPLTKLENIELWSIQHCMEADEIDFCRAHGIRTIEDIDLFNDFEGFARYLKGMDLLTGISTVPIELGAALGTPVWMLGFSPETYFLRTRGGLDEGDYLTLNSTVVAPKWIDFTAPRDECVRLVVQEVCKRLASCPGRDARTVL